ncbi:SGNH/GDSL hydrolase family protein [Parasphingorhabdus cellanae]|uniref:PEPxxWA-CTERM sorting domain-containing protein n=1 Tax=Parasphingorhabdus cellanae TaxID=2806553 RepID=A0ABX7T4A0_9SPHN|nr:SGNH/GDSL hydrolase family protein [Parasphingorhabdus cellanae]QTD56408.1 PEPxxWA-CTERM sorting domain-containing protein [Parasphingorhabdus cellanae]
MKVRFFGALAGGLVLATAVPAHAERDTERFTSLTVFGDSLVDAGNVFTATGGAIPAASAGYFNGRFTNGFDYTDLLSIDLFGAPTLASLQGGTNFAFGGARASNTDPRVPDFGEQLGLYAGYLAAGNEVDANGLYILNFGGNDILNAPDDPAAADVVIRQAAQDYAAGVQALNDIGVRNVLLTGFPVAGPLGFNAENYLTQELDALSLTSDTSFFRYSYLDFFNRVIADPGALGLPSQRLDITCQAAGAAAIANGCDGIFSFDGIHFSAPIHEALARDMDSQFNLLGSVPEPTTWAMMIFGFFMTGTAIRRRQRVRVSYS